MTIDGDVALPVEHEEPRSTRDRTTNSDQCVSLHSEPESAVEASDDVERGRKAFLSIIAQYEAEVRDLRHKLHEEHNRRKELEEDLRQMELEIRELEDENEKMRKELETKRENVVKETPARPTPMARDRDASNNMRTSSYELSPKSRLQAGNQQAVAEPDHKRSPPSQSGKPTPKIRVNYRTPLPDIGTGNRPKNPSSP